MEKFHISNSLKKNALTFLRSAVRSSTSLASEASCLAVTSRITIKSSEFRVCNSWTSLNETSRSEMAPSASKTSIINH